MTYDLNNLQEQVRPWADHNFPNDEIIHTALGLGEEAGEAQRAVLKMVQGIRGTKEEWLDELRKELGDVVIRASMIADKAGLSLNRCVWERWKDVKQRDLIANPNGHGLPEE